LRQAIQKAKQQKDSWQEQNEKLLSVLEK